MGNIKTKSNKNKILIYFITAIGIAAIISTIIFFTTRKSALEKCADVGFIYIWGEQNKAYISKTFKEKMSDTRISKIFLIQNYLEFAIKANNSTQKSLKKNGENSFKINLQFFRLHN